MQRTVPVGPAVAPQGMRRQMVGRIGGADRGGASREIGRFRYGWALASLTPQRDQALLRAVPGRLESLVGWAKRSVPTAKARIVLVGTLRFAHPTTMLPYDWEPL